MGGAIFRTDAKVKVDDAVFAFESEQIGEGQKRLRVSGDKCDASGTSVRTATLTPEEQRAFAERIANLRRAEGALAEMEKAVERRDFPAAVESARLACEIQRSVPSPSSMRVSSCDLHLARRLIATRQLDEALALSRKSAESFASSPGRLEALTAMQLQAQTLYFLGKPVEMYELARRAHEGRVRILGDLHPDTVSSQNTLAVALQALGRLDEAVAAYERVIQLQETRTGPTSDETLRAKANLSSVLQLRGDFERVVSLQTDVYRARLKDFGESDPATLTALHDLGIALVDAGDIEAAFRLVSASLPVFVEKLGSDHVQTLRIRTLLGVIYDRLGRADEALPLFSEVYAARRRLFGDAHASTVSAAFNTADMLVKLDRPQEALVVVDQALSKLPGGTNRVSAVEQGLLLIKANSYLASSDARRALETLESHLGAGMPDPTEASRATARQLSIAASWSQAQFELGNTDRAVEAIETVFRSCRTRFGEGHALALESMAMLANMLATSGKADRAEALLAEFVEINERLLREGVATSTANRGRLVQGVRDRPNMAGYRTYVRLLAVRDPTRALEIAELTKARSLAETLARPQADNPTVKAARIRFARADERVAAVDIGSAPYMKAVADRTKAEEDLRKAIGPTMRRPAVDVRATLKRVLMPGTAFVDFIVSGDRVTAITSNNQAKVTARDLGTIAGLADLVEAFRRATTSPDPASERMWIFPDGSIRWSLSQPQGATRLTDLDAIGKKLSARLLDPLTPDIGNAKTWIISPDGPLAFLPFEALRIGKQLVLETKNVVYTPSLSSLAIMPARVTTGPRWDFLGVGVSNFGKSSPWRDLPEAEAEVNAIGELFPVSRVLIGAQATEERFRTLDTAGELRRYRYVHFATHAFLSDRGTSLSGVVLAGAGTTGGDGIITAAEWPTYRLDSDLVVLSACDTGLGRLVAGEGVVGLPSAFLTAGTRAVVLTLWSVADSSAAEFMPRFYKRLKAGRAPAEALRETKLELARSKGPWSSPRHWAPYVLYGAP
ncbi:hypothetical protein BWI17_05425 [Betaproteobacteria bacterium GR16-43]|nr:hypothetical protein BWI17_05425 [Betaproteobacteria bacterium GR16-43]